AAGIGFALSHVALRLNVGAEVFVAIATPAQDLLAWFVEHDWCIWAWGLAALAIGVASLMWLATAMLCYVPEALCHARRRFHDCPSCHHRGRPVHVCPKCGSAEQDLRPSGYGVLSARCEECRERLPTLDVFGRHRLRRKCGHCDSVWSN